LERGPTPGGKKTAEPRKFTPEELAGFDGKERKPAYVAYRGKVYEVTESPLWAQGNHQDAHLAGKDLTAEMAAAPHGEEVFDPYPVVGEYVAEEKEGTEEEPTPLTKLLKAYVRYHPHPPSVHFPIALMATTALLVVVFLMTGRRSFETASFYTLVLGLLSTPPSILTGFISWKITYGGTMTPIFRRKIQFSVLLLLIGGVATFLRFTRPEILISQTLLGLVYLLLVLSLAPIVLILGYYGGKITFPTAF
jgi:predicted heme/steroid binding protein/uncharacterized membrane protein